MEKILFRGKTNAGRWAYGSLILAKDFCCILESEEVVHPMDYPYLDGDLGVIDGRVTPVSPETVCRLLEYPSYGTGGHDEVYEGDIVDIYYSHYGENDCMGKRAIAIDEWTISENGLGRWFPQDTITVKVIGNVFDTPELIGAELAAQYKQNHGFNLEKIPE